MDDLKRLEIKQLIQKEIEKTKTSIAEYEDMAQPIAPENSIGRVSRMDAINNKSVVEAALRTARKKLGSLQTALGKVDEKDFGRCKRCKKTIPAKRLMFLPESPFCVHCAR